MTTAVATETGPLTTNDALPESMLFGTDGQAALWLVFVGLGGRYAAVKNSRYWRRWNGSAWEQCATEDVLRIVRRVLGSVYDRRMEQDPTPAQVMQLLRMMDLNWRLGPLLTQLRQAAMVPAERLR